MKYSRSITLGALLCSIPALTAGAATTPDDVPACDSQAFALLRSSIYESLEESWEAVAYCINDPEADFQECLREIRQERREARELARAQYEARLEVCELLGQEPYRPEVDRDMFSPSNANPYLPLIVGRTLVYEKADEDTIERVEVTALDEVVEIDGFECRSVRDIVYEIEASDRGSQTLVEDTVDWFSVRDDGDVWYIGEIAKNYDEDGFLEDLDGSWRSGVEDAQPGLLVPAAPVPGLVHRQEFLIGEAEDMARVISVGDTVEIEIGTFTDCLQTEEWSPLEPGKFERKFYAPGIGLILEVDLETGERLELVEILN